jgi:hypothetical protein
MRSFSKQSGNDVPKPTLRLVRHLRIHASLHADWLDLTQRLELLVQRMPNLQSVHNMSPSLKKQASFLWLAGVSAVSLVAIHLVIGPESREVFRVLPLFPQLQSLGLIFTRYEFRGIRDWVFDTKYALNLPCLRELEWQYVHGAGSPCFDGMLAFLAQSRLGLHTAICLDLGPHTSNAAHDAILEVLDRNKTKTLRLRQANAGLQELFLWRSKEDPIQFQEVIIEPAWSVLSDRLLRSPTVAHNLVIHHHVYCDSSTETIQSLIEAITSRWKIPGDDTWANDFDGWINDHLGLAVCLNLHLHRIPGRWEVMKALMGWLDGTDWSLGMPFKLTYSTHDSVTCEWALISNPNE